MRYGILYHIKDMNILYLSCISQNPPSLLLIWPHFYIYGVDTNYFLNLSPYESSRNALRLGKNYISLFIFSIVPLITNKCPEDTRGKSGSFHALVKGAGWKCHYSSSIAWFHSVTCHVEPQSPPPACHSVIGQSSTSVLKYAQAKHGIYQAGLLVSELFISARELLKI